MRRAASTCSVSGAQRQCLDWADDDCDRLTSIAGVVQRWPGVMAGRRFRLAWSTRRSTGNRRYITAGIGYMGSGEGK